MVLGGLLLLTSGCGGDNDEAAVPTTAAVANQASFCEVQPRFADKLNEALANADPDSRQYEVMGPILEGLAPVIEELRDAEPVELDGVVEEWRSNIEEYAEAGDDGPLQTAETARARMSAWTTENC